MPGSCFDRRLAGALWMSLAVASAVGCGDDDDTPSNGMMDATITPTHDGGVDGSTQQPAALYAMNNEIYVGDDSTTYVNVLPSLDNITRLDNTRGIEFNGGRATMGTIDGKLFVADPDTPVVYRYAIAADGTPARDGEISFANYGKDSTGLDEWANIFINSNKAYLKYGARTIVWNPSTLRIEKEIDLATLPKKEGENWTADGSAMILRGNRVYRTLYWSDYTAWQTSPESYLLAFDTDTDTLVAVTRDDRCPALGNRADRDEQGNLYFSNWIWNVPETIRNNAPKSCVLRLPPGSDKFDDWKLTYSDLTQGREGAMFAILGNGKAVMTVFHLELANNDPKLSLNELAAQDAWRVWSLDLATNTAAPIEGLLVNSGAASTYHIDGRHFMILPTEGWSNTHVYELVGTTAQKKFDATGWSYQLLKIR